MFTILVANPKGGAGKTTIATNLAAYLAGKHQRVVVLDMDRQRSAARWLARVARADSPRFEAHCLRLIRKLFGISSLNG